MNLKNDDKIIMYYIIQELPFTHDLSNYLNGNYTTNIYTNSLRTP
jgi:hypothetical protein